MDHKKNIENHIFIKLFERIADDRRLLPTHISLIAALLLYYHLDIEKRDFFRGSRSKLMQASRIRSITTYHKCLSQLVTFGYLVYMPSWHPTHGSRFKLVV